ncbi:MAG: STAS-like domain-containing protein [Paracoccaceae bacterium]|nr:STAS-like domain-containing protein [Paracoccaceae bacterium]
MSEIDIARDFSRLPGGRYRRHGKWSGEAFREDLLSPALTKGQEVHVIFDGPPGYPPSFIEEAFGGLLRAGFREADLKAKLRLEARAARYATYVEQAWKYIHEEAGRQASRSH